MDVVKQAVDLGRSCDSVVCLAITTLTLNLWSFILIAPLLLCRCWLRCVTNVCNKPGCKVPLPSYIEVDPHEVLHGQLKKT